MSTLTEEQRRKIEENRRKALERRAAVLNGNKATSIGPEKVSNAIVPPVKQVVTSGMYAALNGKLTVRGRIKCSPPPEIRYDLEAPSNAVSVNDKIVHHQTISFVHGSCVLMTRERFFVDITYQKEAIDLFKTIPSRQYDVQTKKWNFAIKDHDKLISILKPLHLKVSVAPLPKYVLNAFSNIKDKHKEEYDLSNLDPVLLNALLPFQKEGVSFGIQHNGRILLADDMGLGKTIQAIALTSYFKSWPLLVITPSSVRYAWKEAFHTWLPSVSDSEITVINSGKDHIPNDKIILMSYDLLTKMHDSLSKRKFRTVILDESHFIKNGKTARTKAALSVLKSVSYILMLTGTPALSRPIELYTQLSALRPFYFPSITEYGIRYCNGKRCPWGWDFSGSSNMGELQLLLEETVMIRRLKSKVIKQLPSKCRQMIVLDPSRVSTKSKVLKVMSKKMQEENLSGMERRGALLEYFHETGAVKIPAVCEYISDLLEADRKFICFAHHQNVLNKICDTIENKRIDYIRIDGSVSSDLRKKLCDKFQLNDNCKVAVLSITSANCGITLTAASLVIFAELFWNPGILIQAEDRAHRIGQEDSVVVQYLVAKGTADDEIWPMVQKKLDILNKAGLSKDNFKDADTFVTDDSSQSHLDDFWNDLSDSLDMDKTDYSFESPEKKLKLN